MKKLRFILAAAIAAIVSVAAGLYSYNATQEKLLAQEQELVLLDENIEALSSQTGEVMTVVKIYNREAHNEDCTYKYKTMYGEERTAKGHRTWCYVVPKDCPPCFYHSECMD